MTIRGTSLRACGRIGLVLVLAIGCGQIRVVSTMPAGSPDAAFAGTGGSDAGSGTPDVGGATPDVGGATPDVGAAMPDVGAAMPDVGAAMPDVASGVPDAKVDSPAGPDATGSDTRIECAPGNHLCGGVCVSNIDPAHCGSSCSPCFAPTGGGPTCDGVSCGASCPAGTKLCMSTACVPLTTACGGDCPSGMHVCNDLCFSNNSVASCGVSCTPCVAPVGGAVSCDGVSCIVSCPAGTKLCAGACIPGAQSCLGVCQTGMHDCNGTCQSNTDPANCGAACTACPAPANAVALCDGASCNVLCNSGFHLCAGNCVQNDSVLNCGASCTPCPVPPGGNATCDGQVCGMEMPHPG